jgi:RNA polymerase sigma-70 factor (ECF subfamily)
VDTFERRRFHRGLGEADGGVVDSGSRFEAETSRFRRELLASCYQLLGSPQDAEHVVQEVMLRAWRAWDRYDPALASVRTWLHHIVTNAALSALKSRGRRPLPTTLVEPGDDVTVPLTPDRDVPWLLPIATSSIDAGPDDPVTRAIGRGQVRLAFTAALQLLPARQRAAIILTDVLEFSAPEAATILQTTATAVRSLAQRARTRLADVEPADTLAAASETATAALVERYTDAFVRADVAALVTLLTDDVVMEMPPVPLWFSGRERYRAFMERVFRMRGGRWRVLPVRANGQLGFAAYTIDGDHHRFHTVQVLSARGGRVGRNTTYHDTAVAELLGLPAVLV